MFRVKFWPDGRFTESHLFAESEPPQAPFTLSKPEEWSGTWVLAGDRAILELSVGPWHLRILRDRDCDIHSGYRDKL